MRPSTVRGTPVRHISADNGQGFTNAGKPPGFQGTVNGQYAGESATPGGWTPYNSSSVNDDKEPNRSSGKYGMVVDEVAGDQASHLSNGSGVILDGLTREGDYTPRAAHTLDSPVPDGAPAFPVGAMRAENIAHLGTGKGADASQAGDDLHAIGGVMSRDMASNGS